MKIVIAADHAGYELKDSLRDWLASEGHEIEDLGPASGDSVDYPDFGHQVARRVEEGGADRGLLVCGTGVGMAMAANRHPGVRAVNPTDLLTARMSRAHNDANVLALGARVVGPDLARDLVRAFLDTEFEGGRHQRRVDKI